MFKWIFPFLIFTACISTESEAPIVGNGKTKVKEYMLSKPSQIVTKGHMDILVRQLKSVCLPELNLEFIQLKVEKGNIDPEYRYLSMHLDSMGKRKVLEKDDFWGAL